MSTARTIARRRLASQQLSQTEFSSPSQVVAWLVAVQAQEYAGGKWSVGVRLPGSTDAAVERAIENREIVRTWALRGTLHLVAARDVRWLLELVAPRIIAGNARRYRELELDARTLARSNALLAKAVQDAGQLERKELFSILEGNGISTRGQRGVYMLQRASFDALICQGVSYRNRSTFLSFERAAQGSTLAREEALVELARRYFTSRGPATLQDFTWWSGLAAAEARRGLEAVQSELIQETIDGRHYWSAPDRTSARNAGGRAYLLPGFDEFLLAYQDRSASLDSPEYGRRVAGGGMLPGTIVVSGRVVGTWRRTFHKDRVIIAAEPFEPLTEAARRSVAAAARRYAAFLGMQAELK
jgi:hypothetical protein